MLQKNPKVLSVIVPVFKKEKTIKKNIKKILSDLDSLKIKHELIVVVDGDLDKSYQEAKKVKSPKLKVYVYRENLGKGYAVRFGMSKSKGDIVGFLDAGGDISAKGFSMLIEHYKWYGADIIVGSKRHPVSQVIYPWPRRVMSWTYQRLVHILFGLHLTDTQVGIKLFRRQVLLDVLPRLFVKKFAFDIEFLAVAHRLGYKRIFEAPVVLKFPGDSTITSKSFWKIVLNMLMDTFTVYYRLKIIRFYDKKKLSKAKKRKYAYRLKLS